MLKASAPPFGEIFIGQSEHGAGLGHDTLPDQGNATDASLARSTFV
jgi:hypothetical protein